jgi:hypothetical protein
MLGAGCCCWVFCLRLGWLLHRIDCRAGVGFLTTKPSRLPIADWENFAARRVESVWLAETGAAPENRVFLRTGKI